FKLINGMLSLLIVAFFFLTLQKSYYYEPFQFKMNGVQTLVSKAFNYTCFVDSCNTSDIKSIERNKLDKRILDRIGSQTVDIYPWDYSYIAANHLNWKPRPVLQAYASYSRELDHLNAVHFESAGAPEFIIWELRKITHDIHGGSLESIDGRYLLNDEPETLMALFRQYELVETQNGIFPALILKHRTLPLHNETKVIGKTTASWNTWIDVPANKQGILKASASLNRSVAGKLKSFFYKDEATYVYYLLENGDIRMYRIVPKNAAYGLWINPLLINPEKNASEPAVTKIMFRCSNTAMMKSEIELEWNQVLFAQAGLAGVGSDKNIDPVNAFFGITEKAEMKEMLYSENKLEGTARFWSAMDVAKVKTAGGLHSYQLLPDEYSVSFQYPLDSLNASDTSSGIIVRAGAWAKALQVATAVFVITIEKDNKSILWKAVDIQDFIHDHRSMNFITNYSVLDKNLLRQKGLILKVYAWNTGKEPMELNDFSVRIETW
ncbi:MAG: hypothetical protein WCI48_15960, partial [Bacteroidota bacterium]